MVYSSKNSTSSTYRARMTGLPEIRSVKELSHLLRIPESTLHSFSKKNHTIGYVEFCIPKKPNGFRVIHAPVRTLKYIQAWILQNILYHFKSHKSATGFEKGCSILENAKPHAGQSYAINVDIKDFFNSISSDKVFNLFSTIGYEREIAWILTNLVTFKGHLPQGSPCSPKIANLICHRLDARIYGFCKTKNMQYSRYADDITISTSHRKNISQTLRFINNVIEYENFSLRNEKTNVFGRGNAKIITGLVVSNEIRVGREKYREIRAKMYKAIKEDDKYEKEYLDGYLNFLKGVDAKTHQLLITYQEKITKKLKSI
ncbi:retron St85 family RNA-directed DNA polymerase [Laribacter hongkongensis]|uniref:retron St85 family RNA-directed DNA polymerase n=1 Tax=Laribacter hongkongensis TaxID=168471 RepID=UPI001EFDD2FD|nr:retron St85 family RNA-directed DNA polymerase [Laribacter hongkongensis]MCG9065636.1 retron St85 family RNA-directed DNA polymerase [Laribacter hongkongensis]